MKNFIKYKTKFLFFVSIILWINPMAYAQKTFTVQITRKIHNSTYYDFIRDQDDIFKERLMRLEPVRMGGDFEDGDTRFMLALVDGNKNGLFNDKADGINISEYQSDSIQSCYSMYYIGFKEEYICIQVGKRYFKPIEVEPSGKYVVLEEITNPIVKSNIKLFDWTLPCMDFETLDGRQSNFCDYLHQDKYLYIEVWGLWCEPCISATDTLKNIYKDYKNRLEIISLHHEGIRKANMDIDKIIRYLIGKNILWINGLSTEEINWEILQTGYPYGILVDTEGKVLEISLHIMELRKYLELRCLIK